MEKNINPTVQSAVVNAQKVYSIKGGVKVINKGADSVSLSLLEKLLPVNDHGGFTIAIGGKDKRLKGLQEAYYLKISEKGIVLKGSDDRGIFYGLQTLRQLIGEELSVPQCEITDFPAVKFRGVVEGFYGTPWSHTDRLAQFEFYGENKMNTYIYGPKDDPYHCSLAKSDAKGGWRVPYPVEAAQKIKELAKAAKENKVNFVWAIHPGQDIKWNEEDYKNLINKFEHMYDLGVRSFAVFFDDIKGDGTDALKQAQLLNRINREFVRVKKDVISLILCPTEYNKSWANPNADGYLPILGKNLDKEIQIMWTGDKVCADITLETLNWVNERIGRPAYIWWNYPVTDYVKQVVLQGPAKGLTNSATSANMGGFVSNPMEHAEASKIALFGVANYAWNPSKYNPIESWEAAIKAIMPNIGEAYRTFAIHSSQIDFNAHAYYMDESWETKEITPQVYTNLADAAATIKEQCHNKYLLEELTPWLDQAILLGERGRKAFEMIDLFNKGDMKGAEHALLECNMDSLQREAYNAHKIGIHILQPFIDSVRRNIGAKIFEITTGKKLILPTPISSFTRDETIHFMVDGSLLTYYNTFEAQKPFCWVGIDLGEVTRIQAIYIEQGRNNDDSYYMKSAVIEGSANGNDWEPIMTIPDKSFVITCKNIPAPLRYIRMRANEDNNTESRLAIRRFEVEL
ncbi:MAG: beta-N-acetylglucosaminidase domain-containing protein [Bacteroidales bacterium]